MQISVNVALKHNEQYTKSSNEIVTYKKIVEITIILLNHKTRLQIYFLVFAALPGFLIKQTQLGF